jgi:hypothetical protein
LDLLHLYIQLLTRSNTALRLISALYSSLLQTLVSSGYYISISQFLATDFNAGNITISLSYTLQISRTVAHTKSSPHSQTFSSTELHSIILMPQFLNSTSLLPSSYPDKLASGNSTDSQLPSLHNHLRLPSQEAPSILRQLPEISLHSLGAALTENTFS